VVGNPLELLVQPLLRLRDSLQTFGDTWGSTAAEQSASYPADRAMPDADQWMYRAVDVDAPAAVTFRWLCQLRTAPYSYDWLDNRGRRSPQQLTPGLDDVEVGQHAMAIFRVVDVEPGESITLRSSGTPLGRIVVTYRAVPVDEHRSRIVVKLGARYPRGIHGEILRDFLPVADLVMMRRQLLNLAALAARDARDEGHATSMEDPAAARR
jgi:hypothetical protein